MKCDWENYDEFVGAHVSAAGGVDQAVWRARRDQSNGICSFNKNQRQWSGPFIQLNRLINLKNCEIYGYGPAQNLPHDSYRINLGHPEEVALEKSRAAFLDEMQRCEQLALNYLIFPGSHLKKIDVDKCLQRIAESINITLDKTQNVTAVIENTAGQGNST